VAGKLVLCPSRRKAIGNELKLISIDQACGHTSVVVEKNNIEYCVFVDNYGTTKNEVYENSNFRKIRKNSKLHEMCFSFAQNKIAQQAAT
jgi:hypothetical protein